MNTIEVKLTEIKPYKKNAKKHNKTQIENVAESIKQFGWQQPIVLDKNNVIIIGHCRYEAAKLLGYKTAPCKIASDLSDQQVKKLRNLDNKLNESEWDYDILKLDISDLSFDGFNIDWGFSEQEKTTEIIQDDVPDVNKNLNPVSQIGDIWKLGEHRLMCGDSTDVLNINILMEGRKADMVFTDPPYGYEYQSNMREKSKKFDVLKNDDKILDFMPVVKDKCNGFVFVCTTWKVLDKWLPLFSKYFNLSNMIVWDKGGGGIGDLEHTFLTDYEIILCSNNGAKITGKRIGSVWNIPKDNANDYIHATQKPVKLSATAIENTTNKDAVVLDLFGGSGSTLIACEQLNRKCRMMELDPKYCDVIIKRWETLTGKKAVKL